jgi:hypothetical protein
MPRRPYLLIAACALSVMLAEPVTLERPRLNQNGHVALFVIVFVLVFMFAVGFVRDLPGE